MSILGHFVITLATKHGPVSAPVASDQRGRVVDAFDAFWSDVREHGPTEFVVDLVMGETTERVVTVRHPRAFDVADVGKAA